MHNMWHIELVNKMINKILSVGQYDVDEECLQLATFFHGFIYQCEEKIIEWMTAHNYNQEQISKTIRIAWESQRSEVPETLEMVFLAKRSL